MTTTIPAAFAIDTLNALLASEDITPEQHSAASDLLGHCGVVSVDEDSVVIYDATSLTCWELDWNEIERYPAEGLDDLGTQVA